MIISIIIVILISVLFGSVFLTTMSDISTQGYAVHYNGEVILKDTEGLYFKGITELEVEQFLGVENEIIVEIYAIKNEDSDLQYVMNGVTYSWNQTIAGKDVTKYLLQSVVQPMNGMDGKIVIAGNTLEVLQGYVNDNFILEGGTKYEVDLKENAVVADLFEMRIRVGDVVRKLKFYKDITVASLTLSEDIIF